MNPIQVTKDGGRKVNVLGNPPASKTSVYLAWVNLMPACFRIVSTSRPLR